MQIPVDKNVLFFKILGNIQLITSPKKISIFLVHRVLLAPHLHHIDCNYTMNSRVAPTIRDKPNKNHACSLNFCKPLEKRKSLIRLWNFTNDDFLLPCDYIPRLFRLLHYILGTPSYLPQSN